MRLSKKDWEIIKLLKKNGRMSDREIGEKVGLSKSATRWRRTRLMKDGYILISAFLRFDKVGFPYGILLIKLKPEADKNDVRKFKLSLMKNNNVFEIFETLGSYNLVVGVFGENTKQFRAVIEDIVQGETVVQTYDILVGTKNLKGIEVPFFDVVED